MIEGSGDEPLSYGLMMQSSQEKLTSLNPLAPVAIFAYRRPEKLRLCLEALARCPEAQHSDLFIFIDGPRKSADNNAVRETHQVAQQETTFKNKKIMTRSTNLGLSKSIIGGVTEVLERHDSVIVIEDDLEVAPGFLRYMNEALQEYQDTDEVISIHGYCYPTSQNLPGTFFLRGADCWGWATWRRGWELFSPDGATLMEELKQSPELGLFDFNGFGGFLQMLDDHLSGKVDSWAIRWYASAFLKDKLTLYPGKSLVRNTGFDGSGTHGGKSKSFDTKLPSSAPTVTWTQPMESAEAREAFEKFFRNQRYRPSLNIVSRLRALTFRIRTTLRKAIQK